MGGPGDETLVAGLRGAALADLVALATNEQQLLTRVGMGADRVGGLLGTEEHAVWARRVQRYRHDVGALRMAAGEEQPAVEHREVRRDHDVSRLDRRLRG